MSKIHRSIFLKEVKDIYPEIRQKLNQQGNFFMCEVDIFLKLVQKQIDNEELSNVKCSLALVNKYFLNGNRALVEFIRNGICEDVIFEDSKRHNRSWALKYLLPELRREREIWVNIIKS